MKIGTILAVAALAVAGCGKKDEGTPAQSDAKPAPWTRTHWFVES